MRFLFYYLACFFILFVVFMSCNLSCLGLVKLAILGEKNSRGLCWELQRISWKNLFEDLLDCCFTVQSEVYRIKINAFSAHHLDFICTDNFEDSKSTILTAPFVWSGKTIVLFFCFVLFFWARVTLTSLGLAERRLSRGFFINIWRYEVSSILLSSE